MLTFTDPSFVTGASTIVVGGLGIIMMITGTMILAWLARRNLMESSRYASLVTEIATRPLRRHWGALTLSAAFVLFVSAVLQYGISIQSRSGLASDVETASASAVTGFPAPADAPKGRVSITQETFVAMKEPAPKLDGKAGLTKALELIAQDRRSDALTLLHKVADANRDGTEEQIQIAANAYRLLGSMHIEDDPLQALDAFEHVRRIDSTDAASLFELARLYEKMEGPDLALATYNELLAVAKQTESTEWQARALEEIGRLREENRNLDQAETAYREAADLHTSLGDKHAAAEALYAASAVQEEREALARCADEGDEIQTSVYSAYGIGVAINLPDRSAQNDTCLTDTMASLDPFDTDPANFLNVGETVAEVVPYNADLNLDRFDDSKAPAW